MGPAASRGLAGTPSDTARSIQRSTSRCWRWRNASTMTVRRPGSSEGSSMVVPSSARPCTGTSRSAAPSGLVIPSAPQLVECCRTAPDALVEGDRATPGTRKDRSFADDRDPPADGPGGAIPRDGRAAVARELEVAGGAEPLREQVGAGPVRRTRGALVEGSGLLGAGRQQADDGEDQEQRDDDQHLGTGPENALPRRRAGVGRAGRGRLLRARVTPPIPGPASLRCLTRCRPGPCGPLLPVPPALPTAVEGVVEPTGLRGWPTCTWGLVHGHPAHGYDRSYPRLPRWTCPGGRGR